MAYTTIDNPELYFQTVIYTGNATARTITLDGDENMQPDLVWGKIRSEGQDHVLVDSVRGATKQLYSSDGSAEQTESQGLTGFASDGFTLGTHAYFNKNTATYVAWNWLAGNSTSSNGDGSITSTVSANTTAGFSIVSYTGTGSAATVGHGLSSTPELMIFKNRDRSANWVIYHHKLSATPQTSYIYFSTMGGRHSYTGFFNSTAPTSSVFSIGTDGDFNSSGEKMIGYCFNSVKGYSKFGSYTGNGNADGPFEHTGFKPAFIIIKQIGSDGENWWVYDNTRNTTNLVTKGLYPNANNAEVDYSGSSQMNLDFVSNGFKLRASDGALNGSGSSYIYIAFAENPFVTSGTKAAGTAR